MAEDAALESDHDLIEGLETMFPTKGAADTADSSDNELHDEEEKSALLTERETTNLGEHENNDTTKQSECEPISASHHAPRVRLDRHQSTGVLMIGGVAALYAIQCALEQPLDDRIAVISAFLLWIICRFQLSLTRKWSDHLHEVHAILVMMNMTICWMTTFRGNQWISFGVYWAEFIYDIVDRSKFGPNVSMSSVTNMVNDAVIILFFVVFEFVGQNAVDYVFVHSLKVLALFMMDQCFGVQYGKGSGSGNVLGGELQFNIIAFHFSSWFSISRIVGR